MIYVYRSDAGDEFEVERSMHDAPPVGHVLHKHGIAYRRVPGNMCPMVKRDVHFESRQLPRWWGMKKQPGGFAPDYSPDGKPRFASMRDVRNAEAKANHHGEGAMWD